MREVFSYHTVFSQGFAILTFLFGSIVGSFLNVCIYRIPRKKSLVWPPSACPSCGHMIKWYENIPVLSWVFLRGRCSTCRSPISVQYPLVELTTGFLFFLSYLKWGLSYDLPFVLCYLALLIVISGIDITHQIVPHTLTIPGVLCGLAYNWISPERSILLSFAGFCLGAGILLIAIIVFFLVTKKIGMGGGDVMLFGMIGSYLGPSSLAPVLFIASLGGISFFLIMRLSGRRRIAETITKDDIRGDEEDLERVIYFGPFLALGGAIMLFADNNLFIQWVLGWL